MVRMQASPYPMVSVEDAIELVLARARVLGSQNIDITEALGRVLAEGVIAVDDMPPFDAAAVDGYAVIGADGAQPRQVLSEITAGFAEERSVESGTAMRIMTGAPLPGGADSVVMVEQTTETDGMVTLASRPRQGDNVHRRGQDVRVGQEVLTPGTVLGAADIGLLATVGRTRVQVYRRPVVAVLSTGDELVEPDQALRPGAIRDSNRYALLASVREAGGEPISLGQVRDDEAEQEALIREGLRRADVVLTSGGVSVGSRDLIKPILRRIGTILFGRVAFKPGKPTTFATVDDRLVFGLPGFPVSSLVSFEAFVRPALRKMQGHRRVHRPRIRVVLEHPVTPSADRTELQRAVVRWHEGRLVARSTGVQ
ncbi:MAG TPA: gephyrin-like molybdotransferase Glp, partial [Chloroflexota bacterium]|nr:gephyrin-like molybdotransferase Glp [Chloroflexota bacterium]